MPTIQPRRAGVLIPVFALRTPDDLGIGDIGGVRQLIDWSADTGLGFVQFLPINATGAIGSNWMLRSRAKTSTWVAQGAK